MRNLFKGDYFYYVALMLSVSLFLPVVANNFRYNILFSYQPWAIIWMISILVRYPSVFRDRVLQLLMVYGLCIFFAVETIWQGLDYWNRRMLYDEYFQIFSAASIFVFFTYKKDYFSLARIAFLSVIFLFITAILSIISSEINPSYARDLTAGSFSETFNLTLISKIGGGNYFTAIAFMSLFPVLIYYYRNNSLSPVRRIVIIMIILIIFFALIRMQIFGNIITAVIFTLFALLNRANKKKTFLFFLFFITIIFTIPTRVYAKGINYLSEQFDKGTDLEKKLRDLAIFIENGSGNDIESIEARKERFPQLLYTFAKSPFFGCYFYSSPSFNEYNVQGGHLYWMNKLTVTGILLFLLFVIIFYIFLRKNIISDNSGYKIYYLLASLSVLSYGLIKNIVGAEAWFVIFVVLPGLKFIPLLKRNKTILPLSQI